MRSLTLPPSPPWWHSLPYGPWACCLGADMFSSMRAALWFWGIYLAVTAVAAYLSLR
jgi:hypothetical protein